MKKIFLIKVDGKFFKVPEVLNESLLQIDNITYQELKRIAFSFKNFNDSLRNQAISNLGDDEIIQFCETHLFYEDDVAKLLNFHVDTLERFFIQLTGNFNQSDFIQLMNWGADVNYIDFYGETLLYKNVKSYLIQWKTSGEFFLSNCKILLDYGANPNIELSQSRNVYKLIKKSKSKSKNVLENLFREYLNNESVSQPIVANQAGSSQQLTAAELEQLKK